MDVTHGSTAALVSSYVFPNDLHVHWSMMIVLYPYITGLVDGAFIIRDVPKSPFPVGQVHHALLFNFRFRPCHKRSVQNPVGMIIAVVHKGKHHDTEFL